MIVKKFWKWAGMAALTALVLAGCGGDSNPGGDDGSGGGVIVRDNLLVGDWLIGGYNPNIQHVVYSFAASGEFYMRWFSQEFNGNTYSWRETSSMLWRWHTENGRIVSSDHGGAPWREYSVVGNTIILRTPGSSVTPAETLTRTNLSTLRNQLGIR